MKKTFPFFVCFSAAVLLSGSAAFCQKIFVIDAVDTNQLAKQSYVATIGNPIAVSTQPLKITSFEVYLSKNNVYLQTNNNLPIPGNYIRLSVTIKRKSNTIQKRN